MLSIMLHFDTVADARLCAHALEIRAVEWEQSMKNPEMPAHHRERATREMTTLRETAEQLYAGTREPM